MATFNAVGWIPASKFMSTADTRLRAASNDSTLAAIALRLESDLDAQPCGK
jgi:hypothetical protein